MENVHRALIVLFSSAGQAFAASALSSIKLSLPDAAARGFEFGASALAAFYVIDLVTMWLLIPGAARRRAAIADTMRPHFSVRR